MNERRSLGPNSPTQAKTGLEWATHHGILKVPKKQNPRPFAQTACDKDGNLVS